MVRTITVSTVAIAVSLLWRTSARGGEATVVMCWGRNGGLECGTGESEGKATQYCRSQCRYWAKNGGEKAQCREVWRCSQPGWAGVGTRKNAVVGGVCGLPTSAAATSSLKAQCKDCSVHTYVLHVPLTTHRQPECVVVCALWTTVDLKKVCVEEQVKCPPGVKPPKPIIRTKNNSVSGPRN
jgi:hypothetical protein